MLNEVTWKKGEALVVQHMISKGYIVVERNFKGVGFELDIVSILTKKVQKKQIINEYKEKISQNLKKYEKDLLRFNVRNKIKNLNDILVVTEVKSRSNDKFGKGFDAVDERKIMHIKRGAYNLILKDKYKNMQIRFDVASVDDGVVDYIENAF